MNILSVISIVLSKNEWQNKSNVLIHSFFCDDSHSPLTVDCSIYNFLSLKVKQAMAEQGHTQSRINCLSLKQSLVWNMEIIYVDGCMAKIGLNCPKYK